MALLTSFDVLFVASTPSARAVLTFVRSAL